MEHKSKCDACNSLLTTSMYRGDNYFCPYCGNLSSLFICNEKNINKEKVKK